MEGLRCEKVSAGGMWKCNLLAMRGEVFCEKHYLSVHRRMRGEHGGGNSDVDFGGRKRKHDDEEMSVSGENDVGGVRKRGRPKLAKNQEEKEVLESNGGGIGSRKREGLGRGEGQKV